MRTTGWPLGLRQVALAVAMVVGAAASPTTARAECQCVYKVCPQHGKVDCGHQCAYVKQWVPQGDCGDGRAPSAPPPEGSSPPPPRSDPAREQKAEAARARAADLRQDTREVVAATKGRADAAATTRGGASSLSRSMRRERPIGSGSSTALEEARAAKASHTGAAAFPRDPYDSPGKRSHADPLPVPVAEGKAVAPRVTSGDLERRRSEVQSRIAEVEKALAATPEADVIMRATLKQKVADLEGQRGMIVYQIETQPRPPRPTAPGGTP